MMFAASTNGNKDDLYKLAEDLKLFTKIINLIKHKLTTVENLNLSPQDVSNIYSQSIGILSGKERPEEKTAALKILLLQIANETARQAMMKEYEKIIGALK